ncbi:hypothetical protein K439DRAFT_1353185, partial [Ramaria rubella]
VPKMHLVGHKDDCWYRHPLNYTHGAGRTAGELIETVWHELNQANGSAKEMNPGHRHDFLDDMYGDWNWNKMQKMIQPHSCSLGCKPTEKYFNSRLALPSTHQCLWNGTPVK